MGLPLGLVITGIFMIELERILLATLFQYMTSWKRCVDDTISYVKFNCIESVLNTLNCKYFLYLRARMRWYDFLLRCFNYEKGQYHRNHRLS